MKYILDHLQLIEESVIWLKGCLDISRVAVAGHSAGGHTASMLLGSRLIDEDGTNVNLIEPRIKAGVLLGSLGKGGPDLSAFAFENYPFFRYPSFAEMTTPALVVAGDKDISPHLTVRGVDWHADPYTLGPGPKSLLTLYGAEHIFGGISGYDVAETGDDESPERVAVVQRLTWAYLRSTLYPKDPAWYIACAALEKSNTLSKIESK
jgi:pimeloyl-ACP methyl ester carboxylesterase